MSWNLRLQKMIMAGGVFTFGACSGGNGLGAGGNAVSGGAGVAEVGCGGSGSGGADVGGAGGFPRPNCNANPDVCSGLGTGGSVGSGGCVGVASGAGGDTDGGGGTRGADAAAGTGGDASGTAGGAGGFTFPCGNANPDPCICGRAGAGADAAQLCDVCTADGGRWQPATATQPARCVGGHDAGSSDGATSDVGDGSGSHG